MRTRVVVADDDVRTLDMFSEYLEGEGYCVIGKARDGAEAREMCLELKPDLAIFDLEMPKMDGIQAAHAVMDSYPMPIILVTGYLGPDLSVRAAEAGVFGCLVKPVDFDELAQMLIIALRRFADIQRLRKEVSELEQALESRKVIEKAKGIVMTVRGLTEDQAHHYLQMESQRQCRPLVELAKAVVTAHQLSSVRILGSSTNSRALSTRETG